MSFGVTAAVVGAAGAIGGAAMSARASKKAAKAQGDAAAQQAQVQYDIYQQQRGDQAPFRAVGTNALNELAMRLGVGGANTLANATLVDTSTGIPSVNQALYDSNEAYRKAWDDLAASHYQSYGQNYIDSSDATWINQQLRNALQPAIDAERASSGSASSNPLYGSLLRNFTAEDFTTDPGYEFRLGQGQRALESSAAARGGLLSGAAAKALTKYNQDFASNEYGNVFNRFRAQQGDQFNRLASLAGIGQTATNATQQAGQNYATGMGNALQYGGTARASGYAGQANAIGAGLGGLTSAIGNIPWGGNNPYGTYSAQTSPVQDYYTGVQGTPI